MSVHLYVSSPDIVGSVGSFQRERFYYSDPEPDPCPDPDPDIPDPIPLVLVGASVVRGSVVGGNVTVTPHVQLLASRVSHYPRQTRHSQ